jgi:sugar/nucleoside kinase (ribokinase family)
MYCHVAYQHGTSVWTRPEGGYDESMTAAERLVDSRQRASFDVICAGEAVWRAVGVQNDRIVPRAARVGIVDLAKHLARKDLRVGVATVLEDDRRGRALRADMEGSRIDVSAVALAPPATGLVVVDSVGGEAEVLAEHGALREFEIPPGWSSQVLLLCGVSPLTPKAAALCRAARRARRDGTTVVLDAAGSLRLWAGRDPRTLSMIIREAHVVRCSVMDLAILGTDSASVRRAMRADATLVVSDGDGTTATGPFGDVRVNRDSRADEANDEYTVAVCLDLARPQRATESGAGRWNRVLRCASAMDI